MTEIFVGADHQTWWVLEHIVNMKGENYRGTAPLVAWVKCTPFLFTPLELRGEQKSSKMASAEITVFSSLSLIEVSPVPSGRRSALHGGDFVSRPTDNILLSSVGSWRFDPGVSAYVASTSWCKSRQSHP